MLVVLKLIPLKAWLILIAIIAVAVWYWRATDAAYERGKTEVIKEIRQSNEKAEEQANGAERTVENCDGHWDRSRGVCVSEHNASR